MPRPFTAAQRRDNAIFLDALRRTGNARLAARELGVNRSTYFKRRARCAAFATDWDSALAAADAALAAAGARPPSARAGALRTEGGERAVVRARSGRLQLRRSPPGRITAAALAAFEETLGETNNCRLAAAAAGFAHTSFLARRGRVAALARRWKILRGIGADRVAVALEERKDAGDAYDFQFPPEDELPRFSVRDGIDQSLRVRNHWRRRLRPPPRSMAELAPRILARLRAFKRRSHFEATGRWRYDDEEA